MTPQKTEPKLPASVGGAPVEEWVSRGPQQGWGHWKVALGLNPLGVDAAIEPMSPALEGRFVTTELPWKSCQ